MQKLFLLGHLESTEGNVYVLHVADLGSSPDNSYDLLRTAPSNLKVQT